MPNTFTINGRSNTLSSTGDNLINLSPRLFGLPYQFSKKVDPRVDKLSNTFGKKYIENILMEAPICTFIPGEPLYLSGQRKKDAKKNTTNALLEMSMGGDDSAIKQILKDNKVEDMRLYDFTQKYTEYMHYVNLLCRAGAVFLGIDDNITIGGETYNFKNFNWEHYRWSNKATKSTVGKSFSALKDLAKKVSKDGIFNTISTVASNESINEAVTNYRYVQFYVDPSSDATDEISNEVGPSQLLGGLLDQAESTTKELQFMLNSGRGTVNKDFAKSLAESVQEFSSKIESRFSNNIAQALSRVLSLSSEVVKGNNIIIPNIWNESSYSKSYNVTINLKAIYGDKLCWYMDVFVPLMHLLALSLPKQSSANSYGSPFLVKCYIEGVFSCNMGMITSISISKKNDTWTADGLPSEITVSLSITDLYSDLNITSAQNPIMFMNNSSLVEFLATTCGLSLIKPNLETKASLYINSLMNRFSDIPSTVTGSVDEALQKWLTNALSL